MALITEGRARFSDVRNLIAAYYVTRCLIEKGKGDFFCQIKGLSSMICTANQVKRVSLTRASFFLENCLRAFLSRAIVSAKMDCLLRLSVSRLGKLSSGRSAMFARGANSARSLRITNDLYTHTGADKSERRKIGSSLSLRAGTWPGCTRYPRSLLSNA